jgi:hypothetical protein
VTTSITLHDLADLDTVRHLLVLRDAPEIDTPGVAEPVVAAEGERICSRWRRGAIGVGATGRDDDEDSAPHRPVACEDGVVTEFAATTTTAPTTLDVAALLARLEEACATLAVIARQDQEARRVALHDLERYDEAVAACDEAAQVRDRAHQVRLDAEAFVAAAFADDARAAAQRVVVLAAETEAEAGRVLEQRRSEADRLIEQHDLARLLAERQREEAAEEARAAATERAGRLSAALAQARAALEAGRCEDAKAVLGPVRTENPDDAECASLMEIIARQASTVKVVAAEEALWLARRQFRHSPYDAVTRLAALDVDGLPTELGSQVFGEWARACFRLCRERGIAAPLRYAPDPGRGAVLARQDSEDGEAGHGAYVVVSSLGMGAAWLPGTPVPESQVRRARPLR